MKAKNLLQIIAAASLALLAGCATSHQPINSEAAQHPTDVSVDPVGSIAVFLLSENEQERAEWEDSFSASMSQAGISTNPTYEHLPEVAAVKNIDAIRGVYRQTGADGALTVELLQAQNKKAVKATKATGAGFWTALILDEPLIADVLGVANHAYYEEARQYKMRLTLWSAADHNKLWSMDTQSFTTYGVASKDARVMAETVSKELRAKGLVL